MSTDKYGKLVKIYFDFVAIHSEQLSFSLKLQGTSNVHLSIHCSEVDYKRLLGRDGMNVQALNLVLNSLKSSERCSVHLLPPEPQKVKPRQAFPDEELKSGVAAFLGNLASGREWTDATIYVRLQSKDRFYACIETRHRDEADDLFIVSVERLIRAMVKTSRPDLKIIFNVLPDSRNPDQRAGALQGQLGA